MSEGKKGFFGRLVEGLTKTRNNIVSGIDSIFSGFSAIDDDFYEEIEETLIMGDIGIQTTMSIVEDLRRKVKELHIKEPEECKELLINSIKAQMDLGENAYEFEHKKSVVLVIGVSGGAGAGDTAGVLFGLGAAVFYATVVLCNKGIRNVTGINRTYLQFLASIAVLLPYVLLTGGFHLAQLPAKGLISLMVVGVGYTGIAYTLYFSSLRYLKGQEAAILSYIDPLVAVLVSVTVLAESVTWLQAAGGAMILGFTILNELKPKGAA